MATKQLSKFLHVLLAFFGVKAARSCVQKLVHLDTPETKQAD